MKATFFLALALAAFTACEPMDIPEPVSIDRMTCTQVDANLVNFRVELYERYEVHQYVGINSSAKIGMLVSHNPCDKDVSVLIAGERPNWYAFILHMEDGSTETDTVFMQ